MCLRTRVDASAILVQRHSHDAVGRVEGFLDTAAVMRIHAYIQHSLVGPGQVEWMSVIITKSMRKLASVPQKF